MKVNCGGTQNVLKVDGKYLKNLTYEKNQIFIQLSNRLSKFFRNFCRNQYVKFVRNSSNFLKQVRWYNYKGNFEKNYWKFEIGFTVECCF